MDRFRRTSGRSVYNVLYIEPDISRIQAVRATIQNTDLDIGHDVTDHEDSVTNLVTHLSSNWSSYNTMLLVTTSLRTPSTTSPMACLV